MKYLKYLLLLLALVCFFEVYYLHSKLSFIDYPFVYAGLFFGSLFVMSIYIGREK